LREVLSKSLKKEHIYAIISKKERNFIYYEEISRKCDKKCRKKIIKINTKNYLTNDKNKLLYDEEYYEYIDRKLKEQKNLKEKLEKYFNFNIENYIIDDIIEGENYLHLCLMVNLAVFNKRITEENAKILKEKIIDLFNIESLSDRVLLKKFIESNIL